MNRKSIVGFGALALFLASIPFANHWLSVHGMADTILGPIPSAVWVIGFSFVLRDIAQVLLGRGWTWAAIAVGTALSYWLATPTLALASGAAFAFSESTDALIFTPLANRGKFVRGVILSGYLASAVDSALFVRIAFGSFDGWWQLWLAKTVFVLAATPVAWLARRLTVQRTPVVAVAG